MSLPVGPWRTIPQIKAANKARGDSWFAPENLQFFSTRIESSVIWGRFFVTSEINPSGERRYTVREALPDGRVETVGDFHCHKDRAHAMVALYDHATEGVPGLGRKPVPS